MTSIRVTCAMHMLQRWTVVSTPVEAERGGTMIWMPHWTHFLHGHVYSFVQDVYSREIVFVQDVTSMWQWCVHPSARKRQREGYDNWISLWAHFVYQHVFNCTNSFTKVCSTVPTPLPRCVQLYQLLYQHVYNCTNSSTNMCTTVPRCMCTVVKCLFVQDVTWSLRHMQQWCVCMHMCTYTASLWPVQSHSGTAAKGYMDAWLDQLWCNTVYMYVPNTCTVHD